MKLHEFKTKYITRLALLKPSNDREKELRELLIVKLNYLRSMTLPNLAFTLYEIIEHENVDVEFKEVCKEMLEDISKVETKD